MIVSALGDQITPLRAARELYVDHGEAGRYSNDGFRECCAHTLDLARMTPREMADIKSHYLKTCRRIRKYLRI